MNYKIEKYEAIPHQLSPIIAGDFRMRSGRGAASHGLAAWFHNCDQENVKTEFKLNPDQRVLFAQTVGYPENS